MPSQYNFLSRHIVGSIFFQPFYQQLFFLVLVLQFHLSVEQLQTRAGLLLVKKNPFCPLVLLRLSPVYQTSPFTDCFLFILESPCPVVKWYMFYNVALAHFWLIYTSTHQFSVPKFLTLPFLSKHF